MNYNCVLNKVFEQNKKIINVGWRKLLDMELHELYHLLDTLVKKWRATVTKPQNTSNRQEKHKCGMSVARQSATAHHRWYTRITRIIQVRKIPAFSIQSRSYIKWLSLVSLPQEISGWSETEVWQRHKTRLAGLVETVGGDLFRRQTKAGPTTWKLP